MFSKCIKDYSSTQKQLNCSSCRTPFKITDIIPDENLRKEMMDIKIKCECSQIMNLLEYSYHCDICTIIRDEFKNEDKDKNIDVNPDTIRKYKETFDCTLCKANNFDSASYIEHISNRHMNERGVCAICKN